MRPSERPSTVPVALTDDVAPDFIEMNRVALLAFVESGHPASDRLLSRLAVISAGHSADKLAVGTLELAGSFVAEALAVDRAPTLVLFIEGEVIERLVGSPPESIIAEILSRHT